MTSESTVSKTKELVEAARKRKELEQANSIAQPKTVEQRFSDDELNQLKADAELMAEAKVQAKSGTIDGVIDIEAMGDVKGDGGDAKDYDDNDPDKALGVPVFIHGLHETRGGVDTITAVAGETRVSARTRAEQQRGKEIVEGKEADRASRVRTETATDDGRRVTGRTTIEDADTEELAAQAKAKREAEAKAKADAKK